MEAMKRRTSSPPQGPRKNHKIRVPKITVTTGAKLNKTSQGLIYRRLDNRGEIVRRATNRLLNLVRDVAEIIFDVTPTEDTVWKSMRHKDMTKKVRDFLWKHAHGIYRLGSFWNNIPGYEKKGDMPNM